MLGIHNGIVGLNGGSIFFRQLTEFHTHWRILLQINSFKFVQSPRLQRCYHRLYRISKNLLPRGHQFLNLLIANAYLPTILKLRQRLFGILKRLCRTYQSFLCTIRITLLNKLRHTRHARYRTGILIIPSDQNGITSFLILIIV